MKRIGLISDTHVPEAAKSLSIEIMDAFRGVDLILHAGDIYVPSVLNDLACIAPVLAAVGDDDYGEVLKDERVQWKHVLKLEGKTLWLIHERPLLASELWPNKKSPGQDKKDNPDIVVFGHEHRTVVQRSNGVLFVSPGSPTFLHYCRGPGTLGIMTINSGEAEVSILQL